MLKQKFRLIAAMCVLGSFLFAITQPANADSSLTVLVNNNTNKDITAEIASAHYWNSKCSSTIPAHSTTQVCPDLGDGIPLWCGTDPNETGEIKVLKDQNNFALYDYILWQKDIFYCVYAWSGSTDPVQKVGNIQVSATETQYQGQCYMNPGKCDNTFIIVVNN